MSRRDPSRPGTAAKGGGPPSDASVAATVAKPETWRDELATAVRETCRRWTKIVESDGPIDTLELGALVDAAEKGAKRLTTYEGAVPVKATLATVTPIRSALEAGKR